MAIIRLHYSPEEQKKILQDNTCLSLDDIHKLLTIIEYLPFGQIQDLIDALKIIAKGDKIRT